MQIARWFANSRQYEAPDVTQLLDTLMELVLLIISYHLIAHSIRRYLIGIGVFVGLRGVYKMDFETDYIRGTKIKLWQHKNNSQKNNNLCDSSGYKT